MDASAQPARRSLQGAEGGVQPPGEGVEVVGSTIGQAELGVRPHAFIGIEFRRIGRRELQGTPGGDSGSGGTAVGSVRPRESKHCRGARSRGPIGGAADGGESRRRPRDGCCGDGNGSRVRRASARGSPIARRGDRGGSGGRPEVSFRAEPRFGEASGSRGTPTRRRRRGAPTSALRLLFPWPALPSPTLDAPLVSLERASLGLLGTQAQLMEHTAHVVSVIAHAKLTPDQPTDAIAGPDVGPVAVRDRPLRDQPDEPPLLGRRELRIIPPLLAEDRPEEERAPDDRDAFGLGKRLDAHRRKV